MPNCLIKCRVKILPGTSTQEKIKILGNSRSTQLAPRLNPKIKRKTVYDNHGEFQTQSTQRLEDGYDHMNSRNDRLMMRLKPIQVEYYSAENQKKFQ